METTVGAPLRNARIAVFGLFAVFGLAVSTWAVHIPTIQHQTGISTAMLGTMLLLLGCGALVGMQLTGPLISRFGGGVTGVAAGSVLSLLLSAPLLATNVTQLGIGLVIFGIAMGATDVSMNAQAVVVERDYQRPIMSAFHAVFSVGSVLGSLVGAATLALGLSMAATAAVMCGLCLTLTLVIAPNLCRPNHYTPGTGSSRPTTDSEVQDGATLRGGAKHRRVLTLGVLAFLLFLSEGAAMDWSSIHAQQHLGASASIGALAFGSFVSMMTVGRFTTDAIAHRKGSRWIVRFGCGVAFAGMGIVLLSPVVPLTLIGWAIFGLGLSGCIPQVLSTAGHLNGLSGTDFSRVVGLGYAALLAGPALIGWVAEYVPLNAAMLIPLCAVAICFVATGTIDSTSARTRSPAR